MNRLRKFESQLVEGFWSPTATYVFAVIGVTATEAIAGVAIADTAYNAYQSNKVGNASLSLAQGTQGKQDYYNNLLVNLMNDPSSVFTNPAFTASEKLGETAVAHQGAAAYGPNSGTATIGLQQYAQGAGLSFLQQQEQLLAGLSGAQNASSPTQALGTTLAANQAQANSLGSLLYGIGALNKSSGGGVINSTATVDPNNIGNTPGDLVGLNTGPAPGNYGSIYGPPN